MTLPRRILPALAAAALLVPAAGPAGPAAASSAEEDPAPGGSEPHSLLADDLPLGEHAEDLTAGDFTVRATDSSPVSVTEHDRSTAAGQEFTQRLQLGGAGDADSRSVQLQAEAGQRLTVHVQSGGGDEDRALALYDEGWTELDQVPAYRGDSGNVLPAQELEIPADGTYWVASPASGVSIYRMEISDDDGGGEPTPWEAVAEPVTEQLRVDPEAPGQIQVDYTGLIGAGDDGEVGADLARAHLIDESGETVDEQVNVSPSTEGTIALTPERSGDHQIQLQLERHAEDAPLPAEPAMHEDFVLPLQAPEIVSALTSEVTAGTASATVQWTQVPEVDEYVVELREAVEGIASEDSDFTEAHRTEETEATLEGLTVGVDYELRITADRGEDASSSEAFSFTVAEEAQRWETSHAGVGSGGEVTEHEDGRLEFDLRGNNSKIADSEDGFWYHSTRVDPQSENFTLKATFEVDDASGKDNQSGFGIIAVDDFVPGDSASRYFNSAGTMAAKYEFGAGGEEGVRYGTPGGKYVHGYTGPPHQASADRDMSDSRAFDWEHNADHTVGSNQNPPRFQDGDVYTFELRRSNTGFHSLWHREGAEEPEEVIHYDPDLLLTQDEESFHVGLFAARDIAVTVTDWEFSTVHPEEGDPAEEAPTQYVTPQLSGDITATTPHDHLEVPLVATVHGQADILDDQGEPVTEDVAVLEPGVEQELGVELEPGENRFTARLQPDEEQPQLSENQELESTAPVEIELVITRHVYGEPGEAVWVGPEGTAEGDGTRADPLDVHTAVAYAQPGQQVVLAEGTYALQEAVRIERGNSGTAEEPITLMSEPGSRATFDLADSDSGGIILRGDWWHLYDLELTNGPGYSKPLHIQGHHNVAERIESHHNQDTGVQISGSATEPPEMWPSHNTVVSSVAHNNADPQANDADGFAAKLTAGEGNVFRWTISHHNIDDGYDLYAKSTEGPIGTVLIEESVAYGNGRLQDDPEAERTSDGQGFKMGGESMPGDHLLRDSIAYDNLGNGITSNSGPDVRLENVTSVFNGLVREDRPSGNISLRTSAEQSDYRASGVLSWVAGDRDTVGLREQSDDLLHDPSNYFDGQLSPRALEQAAPDGSGGGAPLVMTAEPGERPSQVSEEWFVSTDYEGLAPEIAEDGSVEMNGLFELTEAAPADVGARMSANPDPTVIELLPEVAPATTDDGADDDGADDDGAGDDGAGDDGAGGSGSGAEGAAGSGTHPGGGVADEEATADGSGGPSDGPSSGPSDGPSGGDEAGEGGTAEAGSGSGTASGASPGGGLALTGSTVVMAAAAALILLLAGATLIRRSRQEGTS